MRTLIHIKIRDMLNYMERGSRKTARGVKALPEFSAEERGQSCPGINTINALSERKNSRLPCLSVMSSDQIPKVTQQGNEQYPENLIPT